MKGILKRTLVFLMALTMSLSCAFVTVNADESSGQSSLQEQESSAQNNADTDIISNDGQMNLDVVFVLDASGSMTNSDPDKVAIDAYRLFVDLLDDSCGIGYVVYTHKILESGEIVDVSDTAALEETKKKMASIKYDLDGYTDIALGLTEAKNILTSAKYKDDHRQKVVILLTDGNTALPENGRSLEECNNEMDATLLTLHDRQIPVYSIGLNYNGKMKEEELQRITDETEGVRYETKTSEELVGIFSDIFGNIYQLDGEVKEIVDGNVKINVADNSVFTVSVIIRSTFTFEELAPELKDPYGKAVSLKNDEDIKVSSTGSYIMIKIFYPEQGDWNLHLNKVDNSNCTVTQMDYYSIFIDQEIKEAVRVDDEVTITATVRNKEGIVEDKRLLDTIRVKAVVKDKRGKEQPINMHSDKTGVFTGIWKASMNGEYTVMSVATTPKFTKNSNSAEVKVMTSEEYEAYLTANGISEVSENEEENKGKGSVIWVILIIVGAVIIIGGIIVIIAGINSKKKREKSSLGRTAAPQQAQRPAPPPPKPAPVQNYTAPASDPDLVEYQLIEHDKIENLIKKGPEDPFHMKAEDYKTDESLEALIKKDPDNSFGSGWSDQAKLPEEKEFDEDDDEDEEEEDEGRLDIDYTDTDIDKDEDDDDGDDDDDDDDDDEFGGLDERKGE